MKASDEQKLSLEAEVKRLMEVVNSLTSKMNLSAKVKKFLFSEEEIYPSINKIITTFNS